MLSRTWSARHPVNKKVIRKVLALGLLDAEEFAHSLNVGSLHDGGVVEHAFALLRLFGEDVAVVSVFALDLSCSGKSESLFCTGISLYLGHFLIEI